MKKILAFMLTLFVFLSVCSSCADVGEETTSEQADIGESDSSQFVEETTEAPIIECTEIFTDDDISGFTTASDGNLRIKTADGGLYSIVHGASDELEYMKNTEFTVDKETIYLCNEAERKLIQPFSDYKSPKTNAFLSSPIVVIENKLYAIIEGSKFVILDKNGEIEKTVFAADEGKQIKDFLLGDKIIWLFANNSVYRINKNDHKTEEIYTGVDYAAFHSFGDFISDSEVQWMEYANDFWDEAEKQGIMRNTLESDMEPDALYHFRFEMKDKPIYTMHYYNSANDSYVSHEIFPVNELSVTGKSWWIVPDNAYDVFKKMKYSLPDTFFEEAFNYDVSAGGGKEIFTDPTQAVFAGFAAINYDIKPVLKDNSLVNVSELPDNIKIKNIKETKNSILTATAEIERFDEAFECNIAFIYSEDVVYSLALRSDFCTEEEFANILKSVDISYSDNAQDNTQ